MISVFSTDIKLTMSGKLETKKRKGLNKYSEGWYKNIHENQYRPEPIFKKI